MFVRSRKNNIVNKTLIKTDIYIECAALFSFKIFKQDYESFISLCSQHKLTTYDNDYVKLLDSNCSFTANLKVSLYAFN